MNCEASTLVIQTLALLCSTKLATAEPSAFYFPTEQNAGRIPPWDAPPQVYFGPFISLASCGALPHGPPFGSSPAGAEGPKSGLD
jgi:hypothetical protein